MAVEFDVKLNDKDMYRFNMYHTYTSFSGIFATLIGIAVLVVAFLTLNNVEITYTVLYFLFGIIFIVYSPVTLKMRSKRQLLLSPVLKETLHYSLDDEGIHVSVKEDKADLPWNMVYRIVATKHNLLIYSTRVNAYVIPLSQIEKEYLMVKELVCSKLEKYRLKVK